MRKVFASALLLALVCMPAHAAIKRQFTDFKMPTQQMIEKTTATDPAAATTTTILDHVDGPTSAAAATTTTFAAQPDVPRSLVLSGHGQSDIQACAITVTGTDYFGRTISEIYHAPDNFHGNLAGSRAFKTVTSVSWPADCETGSFGGTWSLGYGEKIGLSRCMDQAGHLIFSTVAGAYESTRATVAVPGSSSLGEVSYTTADFNGTMNGSNDFEAFFIQNFRCLP